jgi:serine phosphatase RsbU (regulator of sigma subunit)/FixJ family two-component response regulator
MSYKGKILIIDDNIDLLDYLKDFFLIYNYEVILAETGNEGIEKFREYLPDIVISDMRLPDKNGNIVVKELKKIDSEVPIIIITGYSDYQLILSAMKNGAVDLLRKPFRPNDLKYLINKIETLFRKIKVRRSTSYVQWEKRHLIIMNDMHIIRSVVDFVFSNIDYICEDVSFMKIGLQEILINAIEHGNLEISNKDKQEFLEKGNYNKFLKRRAQYSKYKEKTVDIRIFSTPQYLKIIVQDMGKGFNPKTLPDPENPENFLKESGKGILMAMHAFDNVEYNETGNGVTLLKHSEYFKSSKAKVNIDEKESFDVYKQLRYYEKLKEDFDFELNLAAEFQNTFLPKKETLKKFIGIKSDYIFKPLFKVSGDFIDFSMLEENIYGFFISDITGHGLAAALISAMLKVFFSLYGKDVLSPQLLFDLLNQEFFSYLNLGEYFTSFYGIYFDDGRKFIYTNANHPAPLLFRNKSGEIIPLNTEGFFVGVFKDSIFEEKEVILEKGDRILFYTDGVIEAKKSNEEAFGEERLKKMYQEGRKDKISDLIANIKGAVLNFCGENINDDITIGIIEVE